MRGLVRGLSNVSMAILVLASVPAMVFGEEPAEPAPRAGVESAETLIRDLSNEDWEVREAATEGLAALGEAARPALVAAAEDPDPETRARVATVLARLDEAKRAGLQRVLAAGLSPTMKSVLVEKKFSASDAANVDRVFRQAAQIREQLTRDARVAPQQISSNFLRDFVGRIVDAPLEFSDSVFERGALPAASALGGSLPLGEALDRWIVPAGLVYRETESRDRIQISPVEEVLADPRTLETAITVLGDADGAMRTRAIDLLFSLIGEDHGYQPDASDEERGAAIEAWRRWFSESKDSLVWDPGASRFRRK